MMDVIRNKVERKDEKGFTLVILLAMIAVSGIAMATIAPTWKFIVTLDNEKELVFRGEQYAQAIIRYKKQFNRLPLKLEDLVKYHKIRKLYKDPITGYDFELIFYTPAGKKRESELTAQQRQSVRSDEPGSSSMGIYGVVSTSSELALRPYKDKERYNEWEFIAEEEERQSGAPDEDQPEEGDDESR